MDRLPWFPVYLLLIYACLKITAPPHLPPQKGSHSPHCSIFISGIDKAFKEKKKKNCRGVTNPAPALAEARGLHPAMSPPGAVLSGQQSLGLLPMHVWMYIHCMAWHGALAALWGLSSTEGCCKCREHHAQHPPSAASPCPAQPAMGRLT